MGESSKSIPATAKRGTAARRPLLRSDPLGCVTCTPGRLLLPAAAEGAVNLHQGEHLIQPRLAKIQLGS